MELWQDILLNALASGNIHTAFAANTVSPADIVEQRCYQVLQRIKDILDDDRLDDPECFQRIEEIVLAFEEIGSSGGIRHDFG